MVIFSHVLVSVEFACYTTKQAHFSILTTGNKRIRSLRRNSGGGRVNACKHCFSEDSEAVA